VDVTVEQRNNQRFKYEAVIWHNNILPGILYQAKIYNLGQGGLYFETDQCLYPGEKIHIAKISFSAKNKGKEPDRVAIKWRDKNARYFDPIEIKWRKELTDSPFRFGYGAAFSEADSLLAKLIVASTTETQKDESEAWEYKKDPRELSRENYRKEITFESHKKSYKGFLFNVNRAGAFIETKDTFSLGQIVKLVVPGDGLFKPLNLTGCVVRLEPGGIGIRFDKRSGRERRKDIDRRTGADRRDRRRRRGPKK
jgi:Tfp pilus assembly protein PilZ